MILHQCNMLMVPYGDDSILSCNMLMVASRGVYFSFTDNIPLTCPRDDAASSQLGGHRQQLSPLFCQQTGKTARDTKVVLFVVANQRIF